MSGEPRLQNIEFGDLNSTLEHLSQRGITQEHFSRIRKDRGFARRVTKAIRDDSPKKGPISLAEARELMGEANIFGPKDWEKYFGVKFTEEELAELGKFPWGEDVLDQPFIAPKTVAETHQAFVGLSVLGGRKLTIAEWSALKPIKTLRFSYSDEERAIALGNGDMTKGGPFATTAACRFGWYLVAREPFPNVPGHPKWLAINSQLRQRGYQALRAVEETTRVILFGLKNGLPYPGGADSVDIVFPDKTPQGKWVVMEMLGWASSPPTYELIFYNREWMGSTDDRISISREI